LKRAFEAAVRVVQTPTVERPSARQVEVFVDEHDFDQPPDWADEYLEPEASPPAIHLEFTDPRSRPEISRQIREVVTASGPLSEDDVLEAVRVAWGVGRAGVRIREAFAKALSSLRTKGDIEIANSFVSLPDTEIVVRVPAEHSNFVRKVGSVDPRELELAIELLLDDASGTSPAELRMAWARLFGWRRVGTDIELAFERALQNLKGQGKVVGEQRLELGS